MLAQWKSRVALALAESEPTSEYHVVRSWLALSKHQHERAISEAQVALKLSPNNVDALEALARAQIFSGNPKAGIELADSTLRQSPTLLTGPLLLLGTAEFVSGNFGKSATNLERAFELGSGETNYKVILAAAYAKAGDAEKAEAALSHFHDAYFGLRDLAKIMIYFPFSEAAHLELLAEGLEIAGAKIFYTVSDGAYLRLTASNRLSGEEIERLVLRSSIEGRGFWLPNPWSRTALADGTMTYSGAFIQPGIPLETKGDAYVEDNLLCERWPNAADVPEICSAIFRIEGEVARSRWGEYALRTDNAPHPFDLAD